MVHINLDDVHLDPSAWDGFQGRIGAPSTQQAEATDIVTGLLGQTPFRDQREPGDVPTGLAKVMEGKAFQAGLAKREMLELAGRRFVQGDWEGGQILYTIVINATRDPEIWVLRALKNIEEGERQKNVWMINGGRQQLMQAGQNGCPWAYGLLALNYGPGNPDKEVALGNFIEKASWSELANAGGMAKEKNDYETADRLYAEAKKRCPSWLRRCGLWIEEKLSDIVTLRLFKYCIEFLTDS
jgi:hypothetical protein